MTAAYTSPLIEDLERQILAAKIRMDEAARVAREAYQKWYDIALETDRLASKIGHPAAHKRTRDRSHAAYIEMLRTEAEHAKVFPAYYDLLDKRDALLPKGHRR